MARKKRKAVIKPGCLITVLALVVSCVVLFLTPLFHITDVEVTGNSRATRAEILIASEIGINKNIFTINKAASIKAIKALGYIEDVKIKRVLPDKVTIEITEGEAQAYLDFGDMYAGISKKGQTLCHVSKASPQEGVPVVLGIGVAQAPIGEEIVLNEGRNDEYAVLVKLMETFDEYNLKSDITEINVTSKENIVFRYRGNLKVEFGGLNDYELKFNYLAAMLDEFGGEPAGVINLQTENYTYRNTIDQKI